VRSPLKRRFPEEWETRPLGQTTYPGSWLLQV